MLKNLYSCISLGLIATEFRSPLAPRRVEDDSHKPGLANNALAVHESSSPTSTIYLTARNKVVLVPSLNKLNKESKMVLKEDLEYNTVARVLESWERCRYHKEFEDKVGTLALLKLMELQPRTKAIFGFDLDYAPTPRELEESGNLMHAIRMVHMFDAALNMLGPDTETLREILHDLGKRHIGYGVSPHFFPFMGQAVIYALQETLGDEWNDDLEASWIDVYEQLSGEIMRSILNGL